jgi:hypothetical protein
MEGDEGLFAFAGLYVLKNLVLVIDKKVAFLIGWLGHCGHGWLLD